MLINLTQLAKLETPSSHDIEFLRSWLERPSMGDFALRGLDRDAWDHRDEEDIAAIKPRPAPDLFSKWFTNTLISFIHRTVGEKLKVRIARLCNRQSLTMAKMPNDGEAGDGIYTYQESTLATAINIMVTIFASILPILSIVVLAAIQSDGLKIGIIIVFSTLFSTVLVSTTNARRSEIFACTAA